MKHCHSLTIAILLMLLPSFAQAQSGKPDKKKSQERTIALWGHVYDSFTRHGLPAKITLMLSDSTVVDTTTAEKYDDAPYRFDVPARNEHYIIRAVMDGYEPCYVNYYVHHIARNDYFDAPWHYLKRVKNEEVSVKNSSAQGNDFSRSTLQSSLQEVVVTGTKIRMVHHGDTIVYNASAFNLPEGSMLDALVRQLPGAELKSNGDIYINGRKIDYLTLNGTDFFKGKNRVMLDNLPYYTVKNIKVYNKSSERSRFLGEEVEKKDYVMDVNLKKEYSRGLLGNVEGGLGTDNRYMARLFAMLFTQKSRLSTYANLNNVNETRRPGGDGDWNPTNNTQGLKSTKETGFNFHHENGGKLEEDMNGSVNWSDADNETRSRREDNVGGTSVFNDSHSTQRDKLFNVSLDNRLSYRELVGWPFSLMVTTMFILNNQKAYSLQSDSTLQQALTNRSSEGSYSYGHNVMFYNDVDFDKKLPWGDHLELRSYLRLIRHKPADGHSWQHVDYLQPSTASTATADQRDYYTDNHNHSYEYQGLATYRMTFRGGWAVEATAGYRQYWFSGRNLMYESHQEEFSFPSQQALSSSNSYTNSNLERQYKYQILLHYVRTPDNDPSVKVSSAYHLDLNVKHVTERMRYEQGVLDTLARRSYYLFEPSFNFGINYKGAELYGRYDLTAQVPDYTALMPYRDTRNALMSNINNPHLRKSYNHQPYIKLELRDSTDNLWLISLAGNVMHNAWGMRTSYDRLTGAYTYMQDNVGTQWSEMFSINRIQYLDKKRRWILQAGTGERLQRSREFAISYEEGDDRKNSVSNFTTGGSLKVSYQIDKLTASLSGQFTWRHVTSSDEDYATLNTRDFQYGTTINYTLPWNISLATDIKMYSRRGYSTSAMNSDDLVWNMLLSRSFLKGKLTARLQAFDILHQLSNTQYTITPQGHTEIWHRSIPRYVMFSLALRFNHNPKNVKQSTGFY